MGKTGRDIQFDPTEGREAGADCTCQVLLLRLRAEYRSWDMPYFLLHGTTILGCSDSQSAFQLILQFAHNDTGHESGSICDVT